MEYIDFNMYPFIITDFIERKNFNAEILPAEYDGYVEELVFSAAYDNGKIHEIFLIGYRENLTLKESNKFILSVTDSVFTKEMPFTFKNEVPVIEQTSSGFLLPHEQNEWVKEVRTRAEWAIEEHLFEQQAGWF